MCFGQDPSPKVTSFELLSLWESVQEKAVMRQPLDRPRPPYGA